MKNNNKKSIKLEWQGAILSNDIDKPVTILSDLKTNSVDVIPILPKQVKSFKLEKKGRSTHPVVVISDFLPNNINKEGLKILCSKLKNILACGGTVENNCIIVQFANVDKVKKTILEIIKN